MQNSESGSGPHSLQSRCTETYLCAQTGPPGTCYVQAISISALGRLVQRLLAQPPIRYFMKITTLSKLRNHLPTISAFLDQLEESPLLPLCHTSTFPRSSGLYAWYYQNRLVYIGQASGAGGLKDRLGRSHLADNKNQKLWKRFRSGFTAGREGKGAYHQWIRENVSVKCVAIRDATIPDMLLYERLMIWSLSPSWNDLEDRTSAI